MDLKRFTSPKPELHKSSQLCKVTECTEYHVYKHFISLNLISGDAHGRFHTHTHTHTALLAGTYQQHVTRTVIQVAPKTYAFLQLP